MRVNHFPFGSHKDISGKGGSILELQIKLVFLATVLAFIVTLVDTYFSTQVGLLAYPPQYDGIGYVLQAKSYFCQLRQPAAQSTTIVASMLSSSTAPFWETLILLNFLILGVGEWQSYTVRFWPTFLLLLLVIRGTYGRGRVTWLAVVLTSLLPTISVNLRASVLELAWKSLPNVVGWTFDWPYLADLRPDLMFSVLLLWALVPLVKDAGHPDRLTWLISGAFVGLAILTKTSASATLILAWILAGIYVIMLNRHNLRVALSGALSSLIPFGLLLGPWVLAGGAYYTIAYVYTMTLGSQHALWLNPNPGLLSNLTYYWNLYPIHMGALEGWGVLTIGLVLFARSFVKGNDRCKIIAYLGIPLVLWLVVSFTPDKNYFLGLPYYLFIWLFSWIILAPFLQAHASRRVLGLLMIVIICAYTGFYALGGIYSIEALPAEERLEAASNRQVVMIIAANLRSFLNDGDCFIWAPAYGIPATLQYYMMDNRGDYPKTISDYPLTETPAQFIDRYVRNCKAVLSYEQDIQVVARYFWVSPLYVPYLRAVSKWVREPANSYELVTKYLLLTPDGSLTLDLFVKHNEPNLVTGNQQFLTTTLLVRTSTRSVLTFGTFKFPARLVGNSCLEQLMCGQSHCSRLLIDIREQKR
jgi:uncharacterized membrane protein (DUF485 family)